MKQVVIFFYLLFLAGRIHAQVEYSTNFKSKREFDESIKATLENVEGDFYISLFLHVIDTDSDYKIAMPVDEYFWNNYFNEDSIKVRSLAADKIFTDLNRDTIFTNNLSKFSKYIVNEDYLSKLSSLTVKEVVSKYLIKGFIIENKDRKFMNALIYYFNRRLYDVGIADISGAAVVNFNKAP